MREDLRGGEHDENVYYQGIKKNYVSIFDFKKGDVEMNSKL